MPVMWLGLLHRLHYPRRGCHTAPRLASASSVFPSRPKEGTYMRQMKWKHSVPLNRTLSTIVFLHLFIKQWAFDNGCERGTTCCDQFLHFSNFRPLCIVYSLHCWTYFSLTVTSNSTEETVLDTSTQDQMAVSSVLKYQPHKHFLIIRNSQNCSRKL